MHTKEKPLFSDPFAIACPGDGFGAEAPPPPKIQKNLVTANHFVTLFSPPPKYFKPPAENSPGMPEIFIIRLSINNYEKRGRGSTFVTITIISPNVCYVHVSKLVGVLSNVTYFLISDLYFEPLLCLFLCFFRPVSA